MRTHRLYSAWKSSLWSHSRRQNVTAAMGAPVFTIVEVAMAASGYAADAFVVGAQVWSWRRLLVLIVLQWLARMGVLLFVGTRTHTRRGRERVSRQEGEGRHATVKRRRLRSRALDWGVVRDRRRKRRSVGCFAFGSWGLLLRAWLGMCGRLVWRARGEEDTQRHSCEENGKRSATKPSCFAKAGRPSASKFVPLRANSALGGFDKVRFQRQSSKAARLIHCIKHV